MIDPRELRLNNITRNEYGEIEKVSIGLLEGIINGDTYAEGIPLSEEWLIKLGFEVVYDSDFTKRLDYTKDPRFDFMINKQNERLSGLRFKGNTFYNEVKYIHQVQNLYFAVTGSELTIKQ